MIRPSTLVIVPLFWIVAIPAAALAQVARVGDVTRLQGQGTNVLIGQGLVFGLSQTGDPSKYLPTMKALRAGVRRFGVEVNELSEISNTKNVAIVQLEVVIPEHGAREGDLLDVTVAAHAAKSLAGGRLLPTPLIYHQPSVGGLFGFAQGLVEINELTPTSGVIRGGARLERNVFINVLARGGDLRQEGIRNPWIQSDQTYITLVLDEAHAGWSVAAAVAQAVDKELSISADVDRVALAIDSKNIVVLIPEHQLADPASWIRDVEQTPILMESNEARVTVNRVSGTIVVTGDTRISPVVISQRGMTVTVAAPLADGTTPRAAFERQDFVALDREADRQPKLADLLDALNRLKVPFADRVSILEQIHRAGKLHARLMYEG